VTDILHFNNRNVFSKRSVYVLTNLLGSSLPIKVEMSVLAIVYFSRALVRKHAHNRYRSAKIVQD